MTVSRRRGSDQRNAWGWGGGAGLVLCDDVLFNDTSGLSVNTNGLVFISPPPPPPSPPPFGRAPMPV